MMIKRSPVSRQLLRSHKSLHPFVAASPLLQWEYSRLNLAYTVVSKRKIAQLIESTLTRIVSCFLKLVTITDY